MGLHSVCVCLHLHTQVVNPEPRPRSLFAFTRQFLESSFFSTFFPHHYPSSPPVLLPPRALVSPPSLLDLCMSFISIHSNPPPPLPSPSSSAPHPAPAARPHCCETQNFEVLVISFQNRFHFKRKHTALTCSTGMGVHPQPHYMQRFCI